MYRIPLENEQITKALTTPFAPVNYTDAEKEQIVDNIFPSGGNVITSEFISKISTGGILAKIKKLTGKSVVQNNAIVDTDIKGFGSTGKNLFDKGNVVVGSAIYYANGNIGVNAALSYAYIPILPNTTYTISGQQNFSSGYGNVWLDKDKHYISGVNVRNSTSNVTATSPSNARYMGVTVGNADQTFHDIDTFQVELGATATEYAEFVVPYFRNFPITLRSAGSVADEVEDIGSGYRVTRRVGTVDLGSLAWTYSSGYFITDALVGKVKEPPTSDGVPNATSIFQTLNYANLVGGADKALTIIFATSGVHGKIYVKDTAYTDPTAFKNSLNGVILNYELATPIVEYHDYNLTYPVTENGTEYFDSPIAVPCEIEYGIDALNDIVSGVVGGDTERDYEPIWGELLWENASPNSVFASQNLNIDFSKYSSLLIVWHTYAGATYPYISMICEKNITNEVCSNLGTNGVALGNIWVGKRDVYLGEAIKQIQFGNGNSLNNGGTWAQNNSNCIPFRIYGIK